MEFWSSKIIFKPVQTSLGLGEATFPLQRPTFFRVSLFFPSPGMMFSREFIIIIPDLLCTSLVLVFSLCLFLDFSKALSLPIKGSIVILMVMIWSLSWILYYFFWVNQVNFGRRFVLGFPIGFVLVFFNIDIVIVDVVRYRGHNWGDGLVFRALVWSANDEYFLVKIELSKDENGSTSRSERVRPKKE